MTIPYKDFIIFKANNKKMNENDIKLSEKLSSMTQTELKQLAKTYTLKTRLFYSKLKKNELIPALMTHIRMTDSGKIILRTFEV